MRVGKRATIADVAKLAGVSRTSVSRVLNGRGELSAETHQRIVEAIKQLGYRPSEVARSLTSQRTNTIGVIVYDILNPGMAQKVYGAQVELAKHDYQVLLVCMGGTPEAGRACLELLEDRRVDGIIASGLIDVDQAGLPVEGLASLTRDGSHCYDPRTGRISWVRFDEVSGGYQAGRHLVEQGHRRIGVITGPRWWGAVEDRLAGYRRALSEASVPVQDTVIVSTEEWTMAAGYSATHELLDRAPDLTAIWALYDVVAVGTLRAVADRGLRVPEDVAVVGYNDEPFASFTIPRLTSIRASCHATGQVAARLILELLDDESASPREVIVPTELIVRDSSQGSRSTDRPASLTSPCPGEPGRPERPGPAEG